MIKRATLIWMFLATAAGIGLFVLKYKVKSMEGQLAAIHGQNIGKPRSGPRFKSGMELSQPTRAPGRLGAAAF